MNHTTLASALLVLLCACGERRDDFIGPRVRDACDQAWPVCDKVAGCILGADSFIEGNLPADGSFVVRLAEPSTVRVHLFLDSVSSAGQETALVFNEEGCRSRVRQPLSGRSLVDQNERAGDTVFEAALTGIGDHLVEFQSDAQAHYLLKVDVITARPP